MFEIGDKVKVGWGGKNVNGEIRGIAKNGGVSVAITDQVAKGYLLYFPTEKLTLITPIAKEDVGPGSEKPGQKKKK
jgi:hypothetical protein